MKKYNIKIAACTVTLVLAGLAGCLKDKAFDNGEIQSFHSLGDVPKVVEIKLTASNTTNFYTVSFDASNTDTVVDLIPVNLATADAAPQDLHVTLTANPALVEDFNTANGTGYADPAALYTLVDGGIVTIPAGAHTGYLQIKFKPSDFLGGSWAVGFVITNIAESGYTISGNLSTGIVAIGTKNAYDGLYTLNGLATHPSVASLNGPVGPVGDVPLITAGTNSVTLGISHPWGNGSNSALPGGYEPTYIIDPLTNNVTVINNTVGEQEDPSYDNHYDPATRTIYASWFYVGSTGNRSFIDTLVYTGPR